MTGPQGVVTASRGTISDRMSTGLVLTRTNKEMIMFKRTVISKTNRALRLTGKMLSTCAVVFALSGVGNVYASPKEDSAQGNTSEEVITTVNINKADADTLAQVLVGIGKSKAEAIVAYRDKNGSFENIDQLVEVKGIGQSTVEKNKALISI